MLAWQFSPLLSTCQEISRTNLHIHDDCNVPLELCPPRHNKYRQQLLIVAISAMNWSVLACSSWNVVLRSFAPTRLFYNLVRVKTLLMYYNWPDLSQSLWRVGTGYVRQYSGSEDDCFFSSHTAGNWKQRIWPQPVDSTTREYVHWSEPWLSNFLHLSTSKH